MYYHCTIPASKEEKGSKDPLESIVKGVCFVKRSSQGFLPCDTSIMRFGEGFLQG